MTIQPGDTVQRDPAKCDDFPWRFPDEWRGEQGVVKTIVHSRLFGVTVARVDWGRITSEIEVSRLIKIETRALA
jgi:hypothetical protein